ncbi:FHA domain-containing protein [Phototrophicus methaneseepsis]|uniref:FHA domain-containing protein n=1 Tax=Phototrophicus methaneseepsis TaxID=2710758 RepID=A0A7S8E970_9CHLR|nr:FHA domain-containing protein [Phototrophicus methaneseepsis]QPC82670.1 FHA domain-containing protein [Phototrophicus methaneseepsis]
MIKCPNCGTENPENAVACVRCGMPLVEATTRSLGDTDFEEGIPKWGSARFNGTMILVLEVLETQQMFEFNADEITELAIGRQDPDSGQSPAVDLAASDAINKGVSRHHATIVRRDGALHIVDNNSSNGTYLNGQRLVAKQPRILRDGDDIRLGHLVVRITFNISEVQR